MHHVEVDMPASESSERTLCVGAHVRAVIGQRIMEPITTPAPLPRMFSTASIFRRGTSAELHEPRPMQELVDEPREFRGAQHACNRRSLRGQVPPRVAPAVLHALTSDDH